MTQSGHCRLFCWTRVQLASELGELDILLWNPQTEGVARWTSFFGDIVRKPVASPGNSSNGAGHDSAHEISHCGTRVWAIARDFGSELCSPKVTPFIEPTFAECGGEKPSCHNISGRCASLPRWLFRWLQLWLPVEFGQLLAFL